MDFAFALAIIVVVALVFFGGRELPHWIRSLHAALREFRRSAADPSTATPTQPPDGG